MKDFYNSEFNKKNIFAGYDTTYGMVVANPFAVSSSDTDDLATFHAVRLTHENSEINTEVIGGYRVSIDNNRCIKVSTKDESVDFLIESNSWVIGGGSRGGYAVKFKYSDAEGTEYDSRTNFQTGTFSGFVDVSLKMKKDITISNSNPSPEDYKLQVGDNFISKKRLVGACRVPDLQFKDVNPEYAVLSILFLRGFDLPVVRAYYNDNKEEQDKCVDYCIDNINNVFIDDMNVMSSTNFKIRMSEEIEIKKREVEMNQQTSFDMTSEYRFLTPMYIFGEADKEKLKEIKYNVEYITFDIDGLNLKTYRNNITDVFVENVGCNSDHLLIDRVMINTLLDLTKSPEDFEAIYKDGIKESVSWITGKHEPTGVYSTCNGTMEQHIAKMDKNAMIPLNIITYSDKSGITFKYIYDDIDKVFIYVDPCNVVYFKLEDMEGYKYIVPIKYDSPCPDFDKIFIRNIYGIPMFYKNPNK